MLTQRSLSLSLDPPNTASQQLVNPAKKRKRQTFADRDFDEHVPNRHNQSARPRIAGGYDAQQLPVPATNVKKVEEGRRKGPTWATGNQAPPQPPASRPSQVHRPHQDHYVSSAVGGRLTIPAIREYSIGTATRQPQDKPKEIPSVRSQSQAKQPESKQRSKPPMKTSKAKSKKEREAELKKKQELTDAEDGEWEGTTWIPNTPEVTEDYDLVPHNSDNHQEDQQSLSQAQEANHDHEDNVSSSSRHTTPPAPEASRPFPPCRQPLRDISSTVVDDHDSNHDGLTARSSSSEPATPLPTSDPVLETSNVSLRSQEDPTDHRRRDTTPLFLPKHDESGSDAETPEGNTVAKVMRPTPRRTKGSEWFDHAIADPTSPSALGPNSCHSQRLSTASQQRRYSSPGPRSQFKDNGHQTTRRRHSSPFDNDQFDEFPTHVVRTPPPQSEKKTNRASRSSKMQKTYSKTRSNKLVPHPRRQEATNSPLDDGENHYIPPRHRYKRRRSPSPVNSRRRPLKDITQTDDHMDNTPDFSPTVQDNYVHKYDHFKSYDHSHIEAQQEVQHPFPRSVREEFEEPYGSQEWSPSFPRATSIYYERPQRSTKKTKRPKPYSRPGHYAHYPSGGRSSRYRQQRQYDLPDEAEYHRRPHLQMTTRDAGAERLDEYTSRLARPRHAYDCSPPSRPVRSARAVRPPRIVAAAQRVKPKFLKSIDTFKVADHPELLVQRCQATSHPVNPLLVKAAERDIRQASLAQLTKHNLAKRTAQARRQEHERLVAQRPIPGLGPTDERITWFTPSVDFHKSGAAWVAKPKWPRLPQLSFTTRTPSPRGRVPVTERPRRLVSDSTTTEETSRITSSLQLSDNTPPVYRPPRSDLAIGPNLPRERASRLAKEMVYDPQIGDQPDISVDSRHPKSTTQSSDDAMVDEAMLNAKPEEINELLRSMGETQDHFDYPAAESLREKQAGFTNYQLTGLSREQQAIAKIPHLQTGFHPDEMGQDSLNPDDFPELLGLRHDDQDLHTTRPAPDNNEEEHDFPYVSSQPARSSPKDGSTGKGSKHQRKGSNPIDGINGTQLTDALFKLYEQIRPAEINNRNSRLQDRANRVKERRAKEKANKNRSVSTRPDGHGDPNRVADSSLGPSLPVRQEGLKVTIDPSALMTPPGPPRLGLSRSKTMPGPRQALPSAFTSSNRNDKIRDLQGIHAQRSKIVLSQPFKDPRTAATAANVNPTWRTRAATQPARFHQDSPGYEPEEPVEDVEFNEYLNFPSEATSRGEDRGADDAAPFVHDLSKTTTPGLRRSLSQGPPRHRSRSSASRTPGLGMMSSPQAQPHSPRFGYSQLETPLRASRTDPARSPSKRHESDGGEVVRNILSEDSQETSLFGSIKSTSAKHTPFTSQSGSRRTLNVNWDPNDED